MTTDSAEDTPDQFQQTITDRQGSFALSRLNPGLLHDSRLRAHVKVPFVGLSNAYLHSLGLPTLIDGF